MVFVPPIPSSFLATPHLRGVREFPGATVLRRDTFSLRWGLLPGRVFPGEVHDRSDRLSSPANARSAPADARFAPADGRFAFADLPSIPADFSSADADPPSAAADQPSAPADSSSAHADDPSAPADNPSADANHSIPPKPPPRLIR